MLMQKDIILGYKKLEEMNDIKFPAVVSLRLFKFKKQLKELFDWQAEEERALFTEYGATFEDGRLVMEDQSKMNEFAEKINALAVIEHEDMNKIELPIGPFGEISMDDLETLSNIIEFVE